MPLHNNRCGPTIQLRADIHQILDTGHIDIIDSREIKNDSLQNRQMGIIYTGRDRLIPGAIALFRVYLRVRPAGMLVDCLDEVIEVVACVGVVEAFGETVDEDSWTGSFDFDVWVGFWFVHG